MESYFHIRVSLDDVIENSKQIKILVNSNISIDLTAKRFFYLIFFFYKNLEIVSNKNQDNDLKCITLINNTLSKREFLFNKGWIQVQEIHYPKQGGKIKVVIIPQSIEWYILDA